MAHSLGAVMVEGDSRLFVPSIMPEGIDMEAFARWTGDISRIIWIGELLESVVGGPVDLMDVAGLLSSDRQATGPKDRMVPLYVPSQEMDRARMIPGVHWDRGRRVYVADETADFLLVHRYLTPMMRSIWISDRNLDIAMASLVKARALVSHGDDGEQRNERQLDHDRKQDDQS